MTEFEKKYQSEQNHRQNGSENRFFSVTENCNSAATASKKNLRLLVRIGKYVVLTLVVVWLIVQLKSSWAEMLKYDWKPHWFWLTASGCLYLCGYMPRTVGTQGHDHCARASQSSFLVGFREELGAMWCHWTEQ